MVTRALLSARQQRLESVEGREREGERFGNPLERSDGWIARESERDRSDKYLCTVNRFGKERGTPGCGNVAKVELEEVGRVGY